MNAFDTSIAENFNYFENILKSHGYTLPLNASGNYATTVMKKAVHILKSSVIDNYLENKLTIDELKLIGFSIETMLVSCTFRGTAWAECEI